LDYRNSLIEDVADVGAGLGATLLVKVGDGVVVRVGNIVFCPVTLDNATGVLFIIIAF